MWVILKPPLTTVLVHFQAHANNTSKFRWAFCQLETIKKSCHNVKEVYDTLASPPDDLDDTYKLLVERISGRNRQIAIIALQWLTFSNRWLTVKELVEAVIMNPAHDPGFEIANRFEDPLDIVRILSSLVMIQTRRAYNKDSVIVYEAEARCRQLDPPGPFFYKRVSTFQSKLNVPRLRNLLCTPTLDTDSCWKVVFGIMHTFWLALLDEKHKASI